MRLLVTGRGEPVTVFAHGLGGGIPDTRPFGSGVPGTRVFFEFQDHGSYASLAGELREVADRYGATQALGVSLGAGALCRVLADTPDRFTRVVFFLPAVLDRPRQMTPLITAVRAGDRPAALAIVSGEIPVDSAEARQYANDRVDRLFRLGEVAVFEDRPLTDRRALAGVTAEALVIGCRGDEAHPAAVAAELAAVLPKVALHIYDRPGVLWTERADLRTRISGFLTGAIAARGEPVRARDEPG